MEFILVFGSKWEILTPSLGFLLWGFAKTEVDFTEKWENIGTPFDVYTKPTFFETPCMKTIAQIYNSKTKTLFESNF